MPRRPPGSSCCLSLLAGEFRPTTPYPQTDPRVHCLPAPRSELLSEAECELQASEGVHLRCKDHLEQVKSELWSELWFECAQNGAKSECLVVPLHQALTPPECLHWNP